MDYRKENGYITTAALILGISLQNIVASGFVLGQQIHRRGTLWYLSTITLASITAFVIFQIMILDFLTSPYVVPSWWIGQMQLNAYAAHLASTLGITIIFLVRLSVFYKKSSAIMIVMYILGFLVIVSKSLFDMKGIFVSLDVKNLLYKNYMLHPDYSSLQTILAISTCVDLAFSLVGSFGFLRALYLSEKTTNRKFLQSVIFGSEGYRLVMIAVLQALVAGFSSSASISGYNFITHNGAYLPSWTFSLEMYTFLHLSFVSAKKIIKKQQRSTGENRNYSQLSQDTFQGRQRSNPTDYF